MILLELDEAHSQVTEQVAYNNLRAILLRDFLLGHQIAHVVELEAPPDLVLRALGQNLDVRDVAE